MKKNLLLSLLVLSTVLSNAQFIRGTYTDSLTVMNFKFKVGDTIRIGQGSSPERNFRYIYERHFYGAPNGIASELYVIKNLKIVTDKKTGFNTYYGFIKLAGLITGGDYAINLESAIRYKEIISINNLDFNNENKNSSKLSNADELKKLKDLLDQGILTQEEFNTEKMKILRGK